MYINNEDFETWMRKLSKKLSEIGQDLKSLINTKEVFNEDETLLDNQDLAFLLKVSRSRLMNKRLRFPAILTYNEGDFVRCGDRPLPDESFLFPYSADFDV